MTDLPIASLLRDYRPGWSLPQPYYTDASIFEFEWSHIWKRYWLFVGTLADIPRAGDYFTYQANQDSIIIIRGNNGEVFAHYNTCRHRGSLICLDERGNTPKLICPYHQWVYEKDGRLLKARLMPDELDKTTLGLVPVPVQVLEGLLFISLADSPPDFSTIARDYTPYLKPFDLTRAKVGFRKRYTVRTNWKLVAENFRECYHCGPAHPEYCSAVIGANLRENVEEVLTERRVAWKAKGLAVDNVDFVDDSVHFAIRYPLRPGVDSYSLDGKPVSIPMGQHRDLDAGVLGLVVYPNFWMDAVSDYVWTMRLTAVSPSCTHIDLTWLVDGEAREGVDYTPARLAEFWKITGEQDWALCENNFRGIESSQYRPGPYAPVEIDVVKFVDWYIARMREGLGQARKTMTQ